jgi:hypothetical protein
MKMRLTTGKDSIIHISLLGDFIYDFCLYKSKGTKTRSIFFGRHVVKDLLLES